jgi:2'-5' RNA ligase
VSRLFVAAPVPADVRDLLAARLPRPDEPGVRWVTAHQWHVTLRFVGELDDTDEAALVTVLDGLDAPAAAARLGPRVSRLGRSVVCLPVSGLDELAAAVRATTADIGDPPDQPFVGHFTLARLRDRAACGVTGAAVDLGFDVDEVVLVRSTLEPRGARHEPVHRVALRATGGRHGRPDTNPPGTTSPVVTPSGR